MGGMRCIMSAVWLDMVAARSGILACDCEVMVCERPAIWGLAPKMLVKAVSRAPEGWPWLGPRAYSGRWWFP